MGTKQSVIQEATMIKNDQEVENYCNFFSFQNSQLPFPQYSSPEQFYKKPNELNELKEPAKLQKITDQQLYSINYPAIQNQKLQFLPSEHPNPINCNFQLTLISEKGQMLKDVSFEKQRLQAVKTLALLIMHQIYILICLTALIINEEQHITQQSPLFLLLFIPLYIIFLFLSNSNFFRKSPFSILLYILNIFMASTILFFFCTFFSNELPSKKEQKFYFTDFKLAFIACVFLIILNAFQVGMLLIYFCFEKRYIRYYSIIKDYHIAILPLMGGVTFSVLLLQNGLLPIVSLSFLYGSFLLTSINQSFQGRFHLKTGDVQKILKFILCAANSYNYGIIFPLQIGKF